MKNVDLARIRAQRVQEIFAAHKITLGDFDKLLDSIQESGYKLSDQNRQLAAAAAQQVILGGALSDDQNTAIERLILPGLRPAFDVQNDSFEALPAMWQELNDARPQLSTCIKGTGRINLAGHPLLSYAGTAFVCGENLMLTNRHVAATFANADEGGSTLKFLPGKRASVDLKQEVGANESILLEVTKVLAISRTWDVALLEVASLPVGIAAIPLARTEPPNVNGGTVAMIGFPGFDQSEDILEQLRIFRGVFNKKRLQPGKFRGFGAAESYGSTVQALCHDCSTLGGNSGAAAVDVQSAQVWGVHFGGITAVNNFCVPVWKLFSDPAFAATRDRMSFA